MQWVNTDHIIFKPNQSISAHVRVIKSTLAARKCLGSIKSGKVFIILIHRTACSRHWNSFHKRKQLPTFKGLWLERPLFLSKKCERFRNLWKDYRNLVKSLIMFSTLIQKIRAPRVKRGSSFGTLRDHPSCVLWVCRCACHMRSRRNVNTSGIVKT